MKQDYLCIGIPEELQQYSKVAEMIDENIIPEENKTADFGVKIIKDETGAAVCAAYYSNSGDLLKKIFYSGSSVSSIEHYRYNALCSKEKYIDGLMTEKIKYDSGGKVLRTINYEYNRQGQTTAIRERAEHTQYKIEYGYDELMRVNRRTVMVNAKTVTEQSYRYDILDRVVEYKDENQIINVHKLNPQNELLSYTIADKTGNVISVLNKFMCSEYLGTEIDLNGHKTTVNDRSYTDNVMLKKPFTSEDDLELVISKMLYKSEAEQTFIPKVRRKHDTDIVNSLISNNISGSNRPLPISVRKLRLLQKECA